MSDFERRIEMSPSFNRLNDDPAKNYGIGAVRIWFYLIGPKGAVQWQIGTEWYVPSAQEHLRRVDPGRRHRNILGGNEYQPQAWDLGFHSPKPMYEGQEPMLGGEPCPVIGVPCYYDGSTLNAERLILPFLEGGSEAVWKELESYYHDIFDEETEGAEA